MSNLVYHASKVQGLKEIKPHTSTHKKSWVYAAKKIEFAATKLGDNFDFICQIGKENNKGYIWERFEGALEYAYKNKSGSIYKLPADTFLEGQTTWCEEIVSNVPVRVVEELQIPDALEFIKQIINEGKLRLYRFPNTPASAPKDKSDLVQKSVMWFKDYGDEVLDRLKKFHPDILQRVLNELKEQNHVPTSSD